MIAAWAAGQSIRPGLACSAVVIGDDRVAGEERAVVASCAGDEVEHVRRALARPAGDQEHRSARRPGRRRDLDVK